MQRTLQRIARGFRYLGRQLVCTRTERALLARFASARTRSRAEPSSRIALQAVTDDPYYLALFGAIVAELGKHSTVRVDAIATQSLNVAESGSWFAFAGLRLALNGLLVRKWLNLYRSFADGVAYRSTSFRPLDDFRSWRRARRCWKSLSDRQSLIKLAVDGVVIGDLVNDSYLRFKPAPTVDLRDPYLMVVLWQAFRDLRRARRYFSRRKPVIYLTSYTTYIQHGIAARVALAHGVRVFAFGNYQEFVKEVTLGDWTHTRAPERYAEEFAALPDRSSRIEVARRAMDARMSGVIDAATSYMRASAYLASRETVPDVKGCVAVFLHDFFDSPHVYHDMVFPDFWEWICVTIDALDDAGIAFVIKPHPNQIGENSRVLADLKSRRPGARFISPAVSNRQLAEAGIACAVTVYGTVAHEMAYLGVPSIACARHPHVSFSFCQTARTRDEYLRMLRNATGMKFDQDRMRDQSLEFFYMHNLGMDERKLQLRDAALEMRNACGSCEDEAMDQEVRGLLDRICGMPAFQEFVRSLSEAVSGSRATGTYPQAHGPESPLELNRSSN